MPSRKPLKSLKHASLHNIAQNIDTFWCEPRLINDLFAEGNFTLVLGPFELVAPSLKEALISTLAEYYNLRKHHLHLLLDENIHSLGHPAYKTTFNSGSTMKMIVNRCKNLRVLKVSNCDQIPASILAEMSHRLTSLSSLDVSGSKFSNQCCDILAANCPNLAQLDISRCPINDKGISNLCIHQPSGIKRLRSLRKLNLHSTSVGLNSIKTILTNFPDLQWLGHPFVVIAIGLIHFDNFFNIHNLSNTVLYGLKNMSLDQFAFGRIAHEVNFYSRQYEMDQNKFSERFVLTTLSVCPYLTHVEIDFEITSQIWDALASLKHIHSLDITAAEPSDFDFKVLPILLANGQNIHNLSLCHIDNVDLDVIGATCPRLRELRITHSEQNEYGFVQNSHPEITGSTDDNVYFFNNLSTLHLVFHGEFVLGHFEISHMLKQCKNIKEVKLMSVQSLSDNILEEILEVNPLTELQSLVLDHCHEISGRHLSCLITKEANLDQLVMRECKNITRMDADDMKRLNQMYNLNLRLEWS